MKSPLLRRVVHGVLLGGRADFFIQTALPEEDIGAAAPKDDDAGALEWQQGFKVAYGILDAFQFAGKRQKMQQ